MSNDTETAPADRIAPLIRCIRDQRVILDSDLATLYGVQTRVLNQALKRNTDRFPEDFVFELNREEILRISQTVTSLRKLKFSKAARAFTEHGALMAANIHATILKRLAEIDKTLLTHDRALRDVYQKLRPLLEPPPLPPKPEIGFHVKEDSIPYRTRRRAFRRAA